MPVPRRALASIRGLAIAASPRSRKAFAPVGRERKRPPAAVRKKQAVAILVERKRRSQPLGQATL